MKNIHYYFIIAILSLIIGLLNIDIQSSKDIYDVRLDEGYMSSSKTLNANTSFGNNLPTNSVFPTNTKPVGTPINVHPVLKQDDYMSAAFEYTLGDARLIGEAGCMREDVALSINPIENNQLPPLNQGMVNVTGDNTGYRMLPKGMVFKNDINIILPYDTTLLPIGFTPNDIKTYYYDERFKRWIEIERDSVDEANQLVVSKVNHFTDFINAIIKLPEMPETASFAPTQMNDIKAANPLESFSLMQPPAANNMGTANLSYPLWIPAGRKGMQPNLTLSYNSSSTENGIMGVGWNINIPMITTETRWGVPFHNSQYESETYILNGEQLATKYIDENDNRLKYNKLAYKAPWILRPTNVDSTLFYPRVEGAFQKIVRHGTNPSNYYWEVTDKTGIKYFYGKKINQDVVDPNSVLKDYEGHICKWGLTEIRDLNGNLVQYKYSIAASTVVEKYLLIDKIIYTGFNNGTQIEDGKYTIDFIKRSRKYQDESTNCRLGVIEITNKLLDRIDIKYDNEIVRGYQFEYIQGEFGKTLLKNLYEISKVAYDSAIFDVDMYDKLVKTHTFDYFEMPENIFGGQVIINTVQDNEIFGITMPNFHELGKGYGSTSNFDWNIGGTLDVGFYTDPMTKSLTLGGNYMYTGGSSTGLMSLIDIDGDGMPDKVFRNSLTGDLKYRKLENNGNSYFFSEKNNLTWNSPFSKNKSHTHGFGVELQASIGDVGASLGYQRSKTKNYTNTYFVDVDGDGLIDISKDEKVFLNRPINGVPFFTPFTSNMSVIGGSCETTDSIYYGDNIPTSYYNEGDTIVTYIVNKDGIDSVLTIVDGEPVFLPDHDAVRMWVAPYSGTIQLNSTTCLAPNLQNARRESNILDGVKLVIQKNSQLIDSVRIIPNDSVHQYNSVMDVQKGDRLYFRIESNTNRAFDIVLWTPNISYLYCTLNDLNIADEGDPDIVGLGGTINEEGTINEYGCDTTVNNADNKKSFVFNSKQDFLVNKTRKYYMPLSGTGLVNIESKFSIKEGLSDTIRVYIFKNNNLVLSRKYPKNIIINNEIIDTIGLPIAYNDSIWFRVESKTNVNWQKIEWLPILYYDSTTATDVTLYCVSPEGVDNTPQIKWDIIPQFSYYANSHYPTIPFTPTQNIQLTSITPNVNGYTGTEPIIFSIKSNNGVVFQKVLTSPNQIINLNVLLVANNTYYFEWFTHHKYDFTDNSIIASKCTLSPGNIPVTMGFYSDYTDDNLIFGNLYRGWGQFTYKRENQNAIINEPLLTFSPNASNPQLVNITTTPNLTGDLLGDGFVNFLNAYDPLTENFLMMEPDLINNKWLGYANVTYICPDTMSNTFYFEKTEDDVMFPDTVVVTSSTARSIKKMARNTSNQFSISANLGLPDAIANIISGVSGSFGITWGHSIDIKDFLDMNGDRFPDVKMQYIINYTTPQGGISSGLVYGCVPDEEWKNDYTENDGTSGNVGGKYSYLIGEAGQKITKCRIGGISLGGNTSENTSDSKTTWIDFNGDGLPDNLSENGVYFLNIGYSYSQYSKTLTLNNGKNENYGGSAGYSNVPQNFNKFYSSYSGGLGYSDVSQTTSGMIVDINNDGLNDLLTSGNNINVRFNNGNSFITATSIPNISELIKSDGFTTNIYGAVGIGIPIFWGLKLVVNPQAGASWGLTHNKVDFIDMNADGFVDYVERDGDDIKVRFNQLVKVNVLKSVENIVGGSYTLDYDLSENSFESPSKNLILTSLIVNDGFSGDGEDIQEMAFMYDNPIYSRPDRESYGFEEVITLDIDHTTHDIYRKTLEKYHNSEYMRKGLKYYELITDANDNKYIEKLYNYVSKEIATGNPISSELPFCDGEGYPALNEEIVKYYEGLQTPQITTKVTYEHGTFGNIISYHDFQNDDPSETSDDIKAEITYYDGLTDKYLVGIPESITVKDINDNILRFRNCEIDPDNGNIMAIHIENNGIFSNYDYKYDSYGNISSAYFPENINQQRLEYLFKYDPNIYTYPVVIKNESFGYSSFCDYDFKFGKPTVTTDANGNQINFQYDDWGRPITVKSPIDPDSTIRFRYDIDYTCHVFGSISDAKTTHFDQTDILNGIQTLIIVDGLGRVIQTKKDIEIEGTEYRLVSGKQYYDGFGRVVETYYPVIENINVAYNAYNTNIDPTPPTQTTYDILDRETFITLPNFVSSSISYGFNGNFFETTLTDPLGHITRKLTDSRGLNRQIISPNSSTTSLYYNALGELIQSDDPDMHSTFYTYNMLGQRTSRLHPDSGLDTMFYDPAGNMIWRETQNLSGVSPINYSYDYNRIINISYPLNPENNVDYYYGDINAVDNRIGRIYAIEDASGRQEFSYGKMGEVVKNIRTFALPNEEQTYTFKMLFEYDSWNRILKTTYPDMEEVYYLYNKGGQLRRMYGEYNNNVYPYIEEVFYNKFEKRDSIFYGNGTKSKYTYDVLQRLSNLNSLSNNGVMQNIDYTYDDNNNILSIINNAFVLNNGLGGKYSQVFGYDDMNRLDTSYGKWDNGNTPLFYQLGMQYSNDGRVNHKGLSVITLKNGILDSKYYNNVYNYNNQSPHTVSNLYNTNINQTTNGFEWDGNGNLTNHNIQYPYTNERKLCWDEENRLMSVGDNYNTSYYVYDNSGERTYKITGVTDIMNINGNNFKLAAFVNPTLYTSGYLVANQKGYTKHYYNGSERVASAIGLGGLSNIDQPLILETYHQNWNDKSGSLKDEMIRTINGCLETEVYVKCNLKRLIDLSHTNNGNMDVYYYHPDHLGSSSWITDRAGDAIQHLHYLPFGEDWVDQRNTSWSTPYTFSGKEKDAETGYSYFGARYYDSDLSIWLSVDPMSDKYPSMSPYNYCANNPVILVDPDGRDVFIIIWATTSNSYGHAAIAVSNYSPEKVTFNFMGKDVTYTRMVPNGTYTYYDLWPGVDLNNDGKPDEISNAGIKDAYSGPLAYYQIYSHLSLEDLYNTDPSGAENRLPDGVIRIFSDYYQDIKVISQLVNHMKNNKNYTSVTNNCSDLVITGLAALFNVSRNEVQRSADEGYLLQRYSTPNGVYKYTRNILKTNPSGGSIIKNPWSKVNYKFNTKINETKTN